MLPVPRHLDHDYSARSSMYHRLRHSSSSVPNSPCLLEPFDRNEICFASRVANDGFSGEQEHHYTLSKVEAEIMSEVADWLQSYYMDAFWTPRGMQPRKLPPTAIQILLQAQNSQDPTRETSIGAKTFDLLLQTIALQLLASCYTHLPATSASHLPLFQQRTRPQSVTALRLHTHYQFEPAAGHHARASSETDCWPGLYPGPMREDRLAEAVSLQRTQRRESAFVPRFAANGWTDGPSGSESHHSRETSYPSTVSTSSSETEAGFFSRLICQASTPKNAKRKHNTLFTNLASRKRKKIGPLSTQSTRAKSRSNPAKHFQNLTSQAVQRIPSTFRLRRTQSAPRTAQDPVTVEYPYHRHRHSSNPSIGSPLEYPFEIPEIRRISATPAASQMENSVAQSVRLCGRGDLIAAESDMDDSQMNPFLHSNNKRHKLSLPAQILENVSPFAAVPVTTSTSRQPKDYFASVQAATHVYDDKDQDVDAEDVLKEEREGAGPSIEQSPILQQIFAKMDASDDEYSSGSDSDMERGRKRKSIMIDASEVDRCIAGRFRCRQTDSPIAE
ncbi:hypothetical protein BDU57DRAFT_138669 [Ampelomyces quisqualis]|uniref:Uncharacterized protein n=1 Tax=Ampelomyces quisqualis TaxID=50730 RepID=A0A6A5QVF8_AMPQU|nr:hypothetical protein BDU57DRAFT_138669 [Ampelomyces quisqualis]